ncbi:MAG: type 4a pilus biogenesis protein PilO, partial [Burkholderiales bacterium]
MNLDSLKRLDIKDAGNWPMPWKLAALSLLLVAIVFLGYWFDWKSQFEQLETARQKQEQLKTTFLDKKRQAVNLEMYRKQLADIEQ